MLLWYKPVLVTILRKVLSYKRDYVIELFSCATVESAEESDKLKQNLKEEKQTRKRLESKVEHIEDELNDLKHEKDSLERVRTSLGT